MYSELCGYMVERVVWLYDVAIELWLFARLQAVSCKLTGLEAYAQQAELQEDVLEQLKQHALGKTLVCVVDDP